MSFGVKLHAKGVFDDGMFGFFLLVTCGMFGLNNNKVLLLFFIYYCFFFFLNNNKLYLFLQIE